MYGSFLSPDDLRILVQSIIVSRIDNCKSLLYGVLACNLNKLQKLQNACARMIYGKRKFEHVTPLLQELHWLPIRQRIVFKILLFVFKFFHNSLPIYLMDSLQVSERGEVKLKVPRTSTPYGTPTRPPTGICCIYLYLLDCCSMCILCFSRVVLTTITLYNYELKKPPSRGRMHLRK